MYVGLVFVSTETKIMLEQNELFKVRHFLVLHHNFINRSAEALMSPTSGSQLKQLTKNEMV